MFKDVQLSLSPSQAADEAFCKAEAAAKIGVSSSEVTALQLMRRSVDARHRRVAVLLNFRVYVGE